MIESARQHVEQHRRQRQDQHDQDGHHADREREVAALEQVAEAPDAGDARSRPSLVRRDVGHAVKRFANLILRSVRQDASRRMAARSVLREAGAPAPQDEVPVRQLLPSVWLSIG